MRATVFPVLLLVCAALFRTGAAPARAAEANSYSTDLKAFLDEMDRTYPFFDVKGLRKGWAPLKVQLEAKAKACKSDQDFLAIVLESMRYLRDGHMGIVKARVDSRPPEPEWYPGVSFMPAVGNNVIIWGADPKIGEQLARELRPGTIVARIDGKPARAFLEARAREAWDRGGSYSSPMRARLFEYRIALRGKKGEKHKITYHSGKQSKTTTLSCVFEAAGWPHTYNLPAGLASRGRSCMYGKLPSGVGYLYLRYIDGDTEPGMAAALEAFPDAKGWIIDLRGNGGGGYDDALLKRVSALPRPVVGLIDAGCMSAGETFARDIVRGAGAHLMGSTSAGCSSAKRTWDFPSGIATISIPTRSRVGIEGPIEFLGIRPHEEVEAVPEEVAKGLNSEILRAEEYLLRTSKATAVPETRP